MRDSRKGLAATLRKALACDVVITSGGVSVGDYDYVKEALEDAGMRMRFWKVAQRPGHPMTFGAMGGGGRCSGYPATRCRRWCVFSSMSGPLCSR